jgi:hypothetical protein
MPINLDAEVIRIARPYANDSRFSGLLVGNRHIRLYLFYVAPLKDIVSSQVGMGKVIGTAQDIGLKYPGITPHIHVQVYSMDLEILR